MSFEPRLHWSFNGEHILLPSLVLHSFGSFLAACIAVFVICNLERFVASIAFIRRHNGLFLSTETRYYLDCSLSYSTRNGYRVNLGGLAYILLYGEQGYILRQRFYDCTIDPFNKDTTSGSCLHQQMLYACCNVMSLGVSVCIYPTLHNVDESLS